MKQENVSSNRPQDEIRLARVLPLFTARQEEITGHMNLLSVDREETTGHVNLLFVDRESDSKG